MSDYLAHNERVLASLKIGDAVEFKRQLGYSHWGIYLGEQTIIHYTSPEQNAKSGPSHSSSGSSSCGLKSDKAIVDIDGFWNVVGENCKAQKNNSKDKFGPVNPVRKIIAMAMSNFGKKGYNILFNNCEHFVSICRSGTAQSDQVDTAIKNVGLVAAIGAIGGIALAIGVLAVAAVVALLGGKREEKNKNRMDF